MLDFNHHPSLSERIEALIDGALQAERDTQRPRDYLGASRLGVACERALQFEYTQTPVDPGRGFSGRILRVFEVGHALEDLAVRWLHQAGFALYARKADGQPFGFAVAGGRIRGHVDGILAGGPAEAGLTYPALWECKTLNDKSWKDTVKRGVALAKPVYAAQMAIYQAYLAAQVPGIADHPALFTAVNKDNQALYVEAVPFDGGLAQRMSDRAVRILQATDAGELLPRAFLDATHVECRSCAWQDRCWRNPT